jgi:hypothetical protein
MKRTFAIIAAALAGAALFGVACARCVSGRTRF